MQEGGILITPMGEMVALREGKVWVFLDFLDRTSIDWTKIVRLDGANPHPDWVVLQEAFGRYAAKEKNWDRGITCFREGTPFQKRVWEELRKLPWGARVSYQEIANRIGKPTAARAVGQAIGKNRLNIWIPCHRVLRTCGHLGGYWGGMQRKEWLLDHES